MKSNKPVQFDGRTGEGGGQLVRIACALSAVTLQPIRVYHVRGNREGHRGGGLKAQHVAAIQWLADATQAEVEGLSVGSHTVEFKPTLPPTALKSRKYEIVAGSSASSTLLIFQAIFPYLLYAGNEAGDPVELEIHGGTNTSFSPSFEYLDQVLLPTLHDRFGINVERQVKKRSWASGPRSQGSIWLRIQTLLLGHSLKLQEPWNKPITVEDFKIKRIDVSILVPPTLREPLQNALTNDIGQLFPEVDIRFVVDEDSGHDARMYTLLVAHSQTGLRWGQDYLYDRPRRKKTPEALSAEISRKVCKDLYKEISIRGVVDEYLQDQMVVFQALAEGRTSFPRGIELIHPSTESKSPGEVGDLEASLKDLKLGDRMRKDKTDDPFGEGSTHTTTVRWAAARLLPGAQWFNKGTICDGAGISFP
ncbi:EPT/RTPC-like protein [Hypoxylon trugodes]|uniref:EPT/RTPC-like protein n=1 Tax=Hypoxylon trugodes TaxID=326681 RepID=UPI002195366B|nr:EPT/RTPC-like protein [Hypoxylon trugodes]KAI1392000.1 EPT/RTPC-like protein [Hypoxylon trugodes]